MKRVMEWAPFSLRPGVAEAELLAASEMLQRAFLARQPGFLARTLVRAADRSYVDVVWWESSEAAHEAMAKAAASETCAAYFTLMGADLADPGAGVARFDAIAEYVREGSPSM